MVRLFTASVLAISLGSGAVAAGPQDLVAQAGFAGGGDLSGTGGRGLLLRTGSHEAFGRVVFDWPVRVEYSAERGGNQVLLRFDAEDTPDVAGLRAPRNVTGISADGDAVVIAVRPGTRIRHFRLGTRVVIDVYDAAGAPDPTVEATRRPRGLPVQVPVQQAARAVATPPAPSARVPAEAIAEQPVLAAGAPSLAALLPIASAPLPAAERLARAAPVLAALAPSPSVQPAVAVAEAPMLAASAPALPSLIGAPGFAEAVIEAEGLAAAAPRLVALLPLPVEPVAEEEMLLPVAAPALVAAAAPALATLAPVVLAQTAIAEEPALGVAAPVLASLAPPAPLAAPGETPAVSASEAPPPVVLAAADPAGEGEQAAPRAFRLLSTELPGAAAARPAVVVVSDIGGQPELVLSAAETPLPQPPAQTAPEVAQARVQLSQALAAAVAELERESAEPATMPAAAPEPSAAPAVAAARSEGGPKAAEAPPAAPAPVVAAPAQPAPAQAVAAAPPAAAPAPQVVLVQQQRAAPPLPPVSGAPALPPTPGAPTAPGGSGATRIQVLPGQPIPPILGGAATPGVPGMPVVPGAPVAPDQRPALVPVPVMLDAGAGRLLQLPAPAAAVFAADPRIARVQPASPTSLFVMAVGPGRTNVIATGDDGTPIIEYDVTVGGGRAAAPAAPSFAGPAGPVGLPRPSVVESMIRRTIRGGEGVRVAALGQRGYILSGLVPAAADAQRAEAIAKAMAGENAEVINNLSLLSAIQVNLRVRVAEISRQVTRELGFNWAAIGRTGDWVIGLAYGGGGLISRVLPGVPAGSGDTSGRYGVRWSSGGTDINNIIDALAQDNLVAVLAEPNLTAQSGEVASFLAGGEFPVPVAGSTAGGAATVTIEFKQYGVALAFVPTVLTPERLNIRVRPEVSELSETGSITVPLSSGVVRIPGLVVRRAETTVELGSGQSFAIAGLLNRNYTQTASSLIGLGDIPILGALFRSDRFQRRETELVIIATPYLVRPASDPRALTTPMDRFRPATDMERIILRRQTTRGGGQAAPETRRPPVDAGFIVE